MCGTCGCKSAETLSKTSCCCGADEANPCACMKAPEPMECSAKAPKCACYKALEKNAETFEAKGGKRMYCPNCKTNRTWNQGFKKNTMDYSKGEKPSDFRFYVCQKCDYAYDPKTSKKMDDNWKEMFGYDAETFEDMKIKYDNRDRIFFIKSVDYDTDGEIENDELPQEFTIKITSEYHYFDEDADEGDITDVLNEWISTETGFSTKGIVWVEEENNSWRKNAETYEDSWEKGVIRLAIGGGCFSDEYAEWVERQIDGPNATLNNPRYKKIIDKRWGLSAETFDAEYTDEKIRDWLKTNYMTFNELLENHYTYEGLEAWLMENHDEVYEEWVNPNRKDAETFEAAVIRQGKAPKGAVAKAMMNQSMMEQANIEAMIQELENKVNLGLISEDDLMASLKKKFGAEYDIEVYSSEEFSKEDLEAYFADLKKDNPKLAKIIESKVKNEEYLPKKLIESSGYDYEILEAWNDYVIDDDKYALFDPCPACEGEGWIMTSYTPATRFEPADGDGEDCGDCGGSGKIDPSDYMYYDDKGEIEYAAETKISKICPNCEQKGKSKKDATTDYICDFCAQCKRCCETSYGCYDVAICNDCDGSFIGKDIDGCCGSCDNCCECGDY